jgi:hypothetical protein
LFGRHQIIQDNNLSLEHDSKLLFVLFALKKPLDGGNERESIVCRENAFGTIPVRFHLIDVPIFVLFGNLH